MIRQRGLLHGGAAFAAFILSLLLFWPGVALFDSVYQYRQALSGTYDDWHPPIMARLWSLFASVAARPISTRKTFGVVGSSRSPAP